MVERVRRQITTYVDGPVFDKAIAHAHSRRITVSAYVKSLIERDVAGATDLAETVQMTLVKVLIGVDALLKHHPKPDLLTIVKATRDKRTGSVSDEG